MEKKGKKCSEATSYFIPSSPTVKNRQVREETSQLFDTIEQDISSIPVIVSSFCNLCDIPIG